MPGYFVLRSPSQAGTPEEGLYGSQSSDQRRLTRQYYKSCTITGDVDFIFGGADAVFDACTITCNDRMHSAFTDEVVLTGTAKSHLDKDQIDTRERFINGYITAACGLKEDLGFVFRNCTIGGADGCEAGSVFLGRPWRDEARTVFLDCTMDDTIASERFSGWGGINKEHPDTYYGEFGTKDADLSNKNPWVRDIDEKSAAEIFRRADEIVLTCIAGS